MSYPVRRAVAEPTSIFWCPAELAGANLMLWAALATVGIVIYGFTANAFFSNAPVYCVAGGIVSLGALSAIGAREPHLATLIVAYLNARRPSKSLVPTKGRRLVP
jgi:hypothetical protein